MDDLTKVLGILVVFLGACSVFMLGIIFGNSGVLSESSLSSTTTTVTSSTSTTLAAKAADQNLVGINGEIAGCLNVAQWAQVECGSEYSAMYACKYAIDGRLPYVNGVYTPYSEWATKSNNEPWINISFSSVKEVNGLILHGRGNDRDRVLDGKLYFSNGDVFTLSEVAPNFMPLPIDEDIGISFTPKNITWVKLELTKFDARDIGFGEIKVCSRNRV